MTADRFPLALPLKAVNPHVLAHYYFALGALPLVLRVVIVIPIHPKEERGERLERDAAASTIYMNHPIG